MLSALRKLFGFKPSPERRPRKDLLADLESACDERGVPMPTIMPSMTRKDLEEATVAIRSAPAATIAGAAGAEPPEPTARELHAAPPKSASATDETLIFRRAYDEAIADGATTSQARLDAAQAVEFSRQAQTTKPKKQMSPTIKPEYRARPATPAAAQTSPTYGTAPLPPTSPPPKSPWGTLAWADELMRHFETLPSPSQQELLRRDDKDFALAQRLLAWQDNEGAIRLRESSRRADPPFTTSA
jgi:hypothetical protein